MIGPRNWLMRWNRLRRRDGGYILAMAGLILIPLLITAGLAIDIGGNYAQASEVQRAADAGALAGVVWLPDLAKAQTVAIDVARRNGFSTVDGTATSVAVSQVGARRLKVQIRVPAKKYLASQILNTNTTITRNSTAEYLRPIPMGSPIASLGNDPESAAARPQMWLNQSGPGTPKQNGDRHTSGVCNVSGFQSGCTALNGTNLDLSDSGYQYIVRVGAASGNPLRIQVFDPAYTFTGDTCGSNTPSAAEQTTLQAQYAAAPVSDTRSAQRYSWANTDYCPGDQNLGTSGINVRTTYIVRAPDATDLNLLDNPAICAITFDSYTGSIYNRLNRTVPANLLASGTENMPFWQHFRRWTDICSLSTYTTGDYVVQVTTTANTSAPLYSTTGSLLASTGAGSLETNDPTNVNRGHNRFSIRAGTGATVSGTGIGLFAGGRLPIYVNQNSSSAEFYLARIEPAYAGQTLALTFFDVADTAGTASMAVIPPVEYASAFTGCQFTRDNTVPNVVPQTNCAITGLTSANYNARNVTLRLVLPAGYTCNEADPLGCWIKVQLTFTGAPADTTTWAASLLGDPVRLVE